MKYLMKGYDTNLASTVYWSANTLDVDGLEYGSTANLDLTTVERVRCHLTSQGGNVTHLMKGYDTNLASTVYWTASYVDIDGTEYGSTADLDLTTIDGLRIKGG